MSFRNLCTQLEAKIQSSYTDGVTLEQSEKLAAEFLYAQMQVSTELKKYSLDSRMRKSGVKALRASIYLSTVSSSEKKPTEAHTAALIDSHEVVQSEQNALDVAEVEREDLERYFDIFGNAHIYFRGVAKGSFGG